MLEKKRLVILTPEAFTAGLFARRFEEGHWRAEVAESAAEARTKIAAQVPEALFIDLAGTPDYLKEIARYRKNPKTSGMLILALVRPEETDRAKKALEVGADDYLFIGHFVPSEAVAKVNRLTAAAESQ